MDAELRRLFSKPFERTFIQQSDARTLCAFRNLVSASPRSCLTPDQIDVYFSVTELRYGAQRIVMSQSPGGTADRASASTSTSTSAVIDAAAQARFTRLVSRLKAELPPEAR